MASNLTHARLLELLHYHPGVGIFTNRITRHWSAQAGEIAGNVNALGYISIGIDGKPFLAHRLAWLYVHGVWPAGVIDHIDGDPGNNRIANLRDVSRKMNQQNMREAMKSSGTGLLGAYRNGKRFKSSIQVDGRLRHIGHFATAEEAHAAYLEAKRKHHEGCTI